MLIYEGDTLNVVVRRNEDGTNNGSIILERREGMAHCIAKAPRYATDEEWKHNADILVAALASI